MAVDFAKLIKQIVTPLVVSPDDVSVKVLSEDNQLVHIQLLVNNQDLGRVIGKGGKIASAIRTIVYAGASKAGKRVHLDIDAY
ncbi:KH domain-containing protein [Acholeplasma granularum]|uniref:KH domain-containing protein n=1 Tax=Acholeplasma granularum TaxID=264635 RepID=UPI0004720189|nr:KH domain-containing protein [Acholeplasma granularum]